MRIDKKTDNLLVVKDDLLLIPLIFGAIFLLVGIIGVVNPSISTPPAPLYLPLLFLVIGLMTFLAARITTTTADKNLNQLLWARQGLISKEIKKYTLDQIKEVQLRQSMSSSSRRGGTHLVTSIILVLSNGEELSLGSGSRSGHGLWSFVQSQKITSEEDIGKEISDFIKVPFKVYRPPTVTEMLSAMQSTTPPGLEKSPLEKVEKPLNPENKQ